VERAALILAAGLWLAALEPAPAAPASGPPPDLAGAGRLLFGLPLEINCAEPADLEALPGIGPARARALREARPFSSVDDLERVPGIGPRALARLRPWVAAGDCR
jgi:hypothetical protein